MNYEKHKKPSDVSLIIFLAATDVKWEKEGQREKKSDRWSFEIMIDFTEISKFYTSLAAKFTRL